MKILKIVSFATLFSIACLIGSAFADHSSSVIKTINIQQENGQTLQLVHRRYYRYPNRYYYPRGHRYWRYRPYYYRPYYYGYPRHGYIGPNYYGYYRYPYYRRWYGPGGHLHYGW